MPAFAEHPTSAQNPSFARVDAWRRERVVVDFANRGLPLAEIAARLGIPESAARERLRAALVRMLPGSPEEFAALQMSRLNEALRVAFAALADMGLNAVDRILRIVRALNRLHAVAQPLAEIAAKAAAEGVPQPRERNQTAAQPFEKSKNRSRYQAQPARPENAAAAAPPGAAARGDDATLSSASLAMPVPGRRSLETLLSAFPGAVSRPEARPPRRTASSTASRPPLRSRAGTRWRRSAQGVSAFALTAAGV